MAVTNDVMSTMGLISNFWPDLQFDKEDLLEGRPDFIVRFYMNFVAELNDKISYLINEENIVDEFDDIQDFDIEVVLYCKVAKIFRKMKNTSLNLADFYIKNPKKIYPFLKFSIHFMIFLNNSVDDIYNNISENCKKSLDYDKFKNMKEQYLQETASNAENLARLSDTYEQLTKELEELNKLEEKMMEDKAVDEKNCVKLMTELKDVEQEVDNLEYELKLLEDKDTDLNQRLITHEDYESCKNTEKYLEMEYQQLCNDGNDDNGDIDIQAEAVKLEYFAQRLGKLHFDNLDVETLHDLRQQAKFVHINKEEIQNELSSLDSVLIVKKKKTEELKESLSKIQSIRDEFEGKLAMDEQHAQRCYQNKVAESTRNFEEYQKLETESIFEQEQISKIEKDKHTLITTAAEEYQKVLKVDQKTTNKFHNMLLYIAYQK